MKEHLLSEIDRILPEVIGIRRHLHAHPELSGEEHETIAYVCSVFDGHGIPYRVLPDGCGIVAELGHGEKCIGIRAELDALPITEETGLPFASENPGVCHACGHDIHLAAAIGFLLLLKMHENDLPCRVRVFCQPAEETDGGAARMIAHGCMKNPAVSEVYGFHVNPALPVGTVEYLPGVMNAAVTDFELTVRGKSCHGAHPEDGADAIVAAAAVVTALQTAVSRRLAPTTPAVVTVGTICGGTASNVIAGEVSMSGTLRTLDMDTMRTLREAVTEIAANTAAGYGSTAEPEYTTCYPALVNDEVLAEAYFTELRDLLGTDRVIRMRAPSLGADDFAFFAEAAQGCYFNIGCRAASQGDEQVLHSAHLAPDEGCIKTALECLCLTVK